MSCGRRSIELRKTILSNTFSDDENASHNTGTMVEYTSWETYIASLISKYRDGIILECLCELLSDEISSHEALIEGHIALLYSCLTDSLELSVDFPINEVW